MKVFFIALFILSAGQLAASGTSREGGCLPRHKGGFYTKPNNQSIQSPIYLFAFDGLKKEMHKSRSGRINLNSASDSITARFYELPRESRISRCKGIGQNLSDQPITDRQTSVDISSLPAGSYFLRYGNGNTVEVGSLIKE